MNSDDSKRTTLSSPLQRRIDELCDQFESEWKRGAIPCIESLLEQIDADAKLELLRELVILDLGYRWTLAKKNKMRNEGGSPEGFPLRPSLDDYVAKFAELGPIDRLPLAVVQEEMRVRNGAGDLPSDQDVARRFVGHPELGAIRAERSAMAERRCSMATLGRKSGLCIRCPNCRSSNEILSDTTVSDIHCASCGSDFSLVSDDLQGDGVATLGTLGHFELIERIGVGGFASVWKAHDQDLQRVVAVKIPHRGRLNSTDVMVLLREARAAAQMRHRNVVNLLEVGRQADTCYIVSDFVDGDTLVQWRLRRKPNAREVASLCAKIADGLHHAHECGVIHRDLKPQNVMVDRQDEPHLMDFGLAKRDVGEATVTVDGVVLGTPAYMSPEQARGEGHRVDRRTDIYAFGVVLYELLTDSLPFRGNSRSIIDQVIRDPPVSPRKLNSSLPRDLETICLKCLEKDPSGRYPTAAAVAAELRRFIEGQPIIASPVGRVEHVWRWALRQPALASLCMALGIALLVIATGGPIVAYREWELRRIADLESRRANAGERIALQRERDVREELYISDMNLVAQSWESNNLWRVRELLERNRPGVGQRDLRRFEWHYFWRMCHSELAVLRHSKPVSAAVFSPDGETIAVSDHGHIISIYDWKRRRIIKRLRGHTDSVRTVAFSPDGEFLASGSQDKSVRLWRLPEGSEAAVFEGHSSDVTSIAFSVDGRILASASETETAVRLWDIKDRRQIKKLDRHTDGVADVAFSPDGKTLGTAGRDLMVYLWNYSSADQPARLEGHRACVFSLAFSSDGSHLVTGSADCDVKLWDVTKGIEEGTLPGSQSVESVAYSANGAYVAAGSLDHTIRVWDAATGSDVATLRGHEREVGSIDFSTTGVLASASEDGTVRLWDCNAFDARQTFGGHRGGSHTVTYSPDGASIASGGQDAAVKLWNCDSGRNIRTMVGHKQLIADVAFSPDGSELASASYDGTVKLWNTETGKERLALRGHDKGVTCVAYSPEASRLVSSSIDRTVRLWDVRTGKQLAVYRGHTGPSLGVTFSPNGKQIASCGDSRVLLWDIATGEQRGELLGHESAVWSVAFSTDGKLIASASHDEKIILWDLADAKPVHTLRGHGSVVQSLAFLPDGQTLASGSWDQKVGIWDLKTGRLRTTLVADIGRVTHVDFSSDGNRLIASGIDGRLKQFCGAPSN